MIVEVVSLLLEVMYIVESSPPHGSTNALLFDACESLDLSNGSQPQQSGPCPFRFELDKTQIFSNESVVFAIKSDNQRKFKGFMVQGRNKLDKPVGRFELCSYNMKTISCPGGQRNTAAHSNADENEIIDMTWYPPEKFAGEITFYATVVQDRETLWVKQKVSPVLKVG